MLIYGRVKHLILYCQSVALLECKKNDQLLFSAILTLTLSSP